VCEPLLDEIADVRVGKTRSVQCLIYFGTIHYYSV
jgi:hypothetical protein